MTFRPWTLIAALALAMLIYVGLVNLVLFKIATQISGSPWRPGPPMTIYHDRRIWVFGWWVPVWIVVRTASTALGMSLLAEGAFKIQSIARQRRGQCTECGRQLSREGRCESCRSGYLGSPARLSSRFEVLPQPRNRQKMQRCDQLVRPMSSSR